MWAGSDSCCFLHSFILFPYPANPALLWGLWPTAAYARPRYHYGWWCLQPTDAEPGPCGWGYKRAEQNCNKLVQTALSGGCFSPWLWRQGNLPVAIGQLQCCEKTSMPNWSRRLSCPNRTKHFPDDILIITQKIILLKMCTFFIVKTSLLFWDRVPWNILIIKVKIKNKIFSVINRIYL